MTIMDHAKGTREVKASAQQQGSRERTPWDRDSAGLQATWAASCGARAAFHSRHMSAAWQPPLRTRRAGELPPASAKSSIYLT